MSPHVRPRLPSHWPPCKHDAQLSPKSSSSPGTRLPVFVVVWIYKRLLPACLARGSIGSEGLKPVTHRIQAQSPSIELQDGDHSFTYEEICPRFGQVGDTLRRHRSVSISRTGGETDPVASTNRGQYEIQSDTAVSE